MTVLMIGLDGATFTLLQRFCDDGITPFLAGLIGGGAKASLMSTRNPLTPPAWTSMVTGRRPEVHGIYDFLKPAFLDDGSVLLKINDSRRVHAERIWSMANRGGKRATALNFYGHAPAPEMDGYVISGFVPWKHLRQAMHPEHLFDDLRGSDSFDYRLLGMDIGEEKKCLQGLDADEHEGWVDLQNVRDAAWTEVTCRMMQTDRTDLTAVVLDGPDKLQHLFWRFLDPAYADTVDSDWARRMRDLAVDFYRRMDDNVRRMVETAGPDTDVIIVSDHGFGPTTEIVYINEWLSRKGYLTWKDTAVGDDQGYLTSNRIRDHLSMIDWQATTAFCPTPSSNAIYIKRDLGTGAGVSEDAYLDVCLKLRRELLEECQDPATGAPLIAGVDLNKLRGNSYVDPCPDITLRLRDGGFVSILHANEIVVPREHPDGTHRPEGIFIGHGPSFAAAGEVEALDLLDIAPLVLTLLDIPVPADLEGRVPHEVLRGERKTQSGAATKAAAPSPADESEPSEEEREALLRQMKVLGYMD